MVFQFRFFLVPYQPGQITASNIQSSSLRLAWTLPDLLPGNTTYTIYTYEGTYHRGNQFLMKGSTKVYGMCMNQFIICLSIQLCFFLKICEVVFFFAHTIAIMKLHNDLIHFMTRNQLSKNWLMVKYSNKRKHP